MNGQLPFADTSDCVYMEKDPPNQIQSAIDVHAHFSIAQLTPRHETSIVSKLHLGAVYKRGAEPRSDGFPAKAELFLPCKC
jgi:hypothetical protein